MALVLNLVVDEKVFSLRAQIYHHENKIENVAHNETLPKEKSFSRTSLANATFTK